MSVYKEMLEREFVTTHGDEFIVTLVASKIPEKIKNAGAYVFRFWTGRFRLVSTCYRSNPVVVLHVPAEKEHGMLRLFGRYVRKGRCPSSRRVHQMLHLTRPRLPILVYNAALDALGAIRDIKIHV